MLSARVARMCEIGRHRIAGDTDLARPVDDRELGDGAVTARIIGRLRPGDQDEGLVAAGEEESAI